MRIVIVIQARVGSSRLPAKVLLPLAGQPLLARMLERVRAASEADDICVATTESVDDGVLATLARQLGVRVHRGHPTDLLDRHYRAGLASKADVVVKIPSDCPLIDPDVIDRVIGRFRAESSAYDFVTNLHPPTWPDGNDVEVLPMAVLELAWREAKRPFEREHTTPFIWDQPERFRVLNVRSPLGRDLSMTHRFTIDYPEDYRLIARIYDELWTPERPVFGLKDILALLERHPELLGLNRVWAGQRWQLGHAGELRTLELGPTGLIWRSP